MLSSAPTSPAHRHALIAQARQSLLADGAAPLRAEVEPWIARSWQRCLAQGLNPTHRVAFDAVSATALRRSQEQNHHLLRAARPVLQQLTRAIAGMHYFAMLTDARGIVVDVQGHCDPGDPRASAIGRVGIDLSEKAIGTTAISAALTELQPVWLHRGEHFFQATGVYSCAGAPVFGPDGWCAGMLDLTGIESQERPALKHLVRRSARSIENSWLLSTAHSLVLRLNWPGNQPGDDSDGLITLGPDGHILGANPSARQMLSLSPFELNEPLHASDVFASAWENLFDSAARNGQATVPTQELPLWSGLRLQAQAWLASTTAHGFSAARSGSSANRVQSTPQTPVLSKGLKDAQTEMIRAAVHQARGNVAEAARALGISRATVYRKLGSPKA